MGRVIHTCVVMDMETGDTLYDESYLYDGDIAECGGGGGSETNTVDYDYNARMATISEKQQEQADLYFNEVYKKYYMPLEQQQAQANLKALPLESKAYQTGLVNLNDSLEDQRKVEREFYNKSREGVNVDERMGLAMGDVANSWKGQTDALNRSMARMGVNPNSGRYMGTRVADSAARAAQMAGARTAARVAAEDENYQRLANAASPAISGFYQGIGLLKG